MSWVASACRRCAPASTSAGRRGRRSPTASPPSATPLTPSECLPPSECYASSRRAALGSSPWRRSVARRARRPPRRGHHRRGDDGAHAGRLDRSGEFAVDRVDHERGGDRRVQPGDADDGRLVAELAQQAVGGTLQRPATDDRRDGDDGVAAPCERVVDARQGAQRLDRHERVGRGDDDDVAASSIAAQHGGRRPGGSACRCGPR